MLGEHIQPKFRPRDYDVFAGLDVDKKHIDATFCDHEGSMKSLKIPYDSRHLLAYSRRHFPGQKVAFVYEAGPTGYGLHDQLTAAGHPCLVVAPNRIPTVPGKQVKTNRLDSRKLSVALRGGQLESLRVPSESYRQLRHLTQLRDTFVQQSVGCMVRIKALLLFEGLRFPALSSSWSQAVLAELGRMPCSPAVRFKLDRLLENLTFTRRQVLATTREIRRFCQADPDIARCLKLLLTIPGIGSIVASHLLARIGDWRRIQNVRQLAGFFGVVPRESSTGDHINRGSMTCAGDARCRRKLIQAAWVAIQREPELQDFYTQVYHRNPRPMAAQKAIGAVANKLCKRIACVLKNQRPYVVRRAAKPVASKKEEAAAL